MSAYVFYIKQHDRRPNLAVQLKNADNTPMDLTSATGVKFTMLLRGNNTPTIDLQDCVISDAPNGMVYYEWQANDTDIVGEYRGELEITWASGLTQTMPEDDYIKVVVEDDLS